MIILVVADERKLVQDLVQVLQNFSEEISITPVRQGDGYRQRFLVKQGQRLASIDIRDIHYFFSEERFIFFKTKDNQKYLIEYRIEELEQMLDPALFFRANRSVLVSIQAIELVYPYYGNRFKLHVVPTHEKEIIVSRERVSDFRIWMGE
jgi:two-component system response regulator LytT